MSDLWDSSDKLYENIFAIVKISILFVECLNENA